jgi:predicted O-methyltransferase YrrM
MMGENEIRIVERIFQIFSTKTVLEFGAGGSTAYYSRLVQLWVSLEQSEEIISKLASKPCVNVRMIKSSDYIVDSAGLGRFDFVLVDGGKRKEILGHCLKLIESDGVVLLHDAERAEYHPAFYLFPYFRVLARGKLDHKNKTHLGLTAFCRSKDVARLLDSNGLSLPLESL